MSIEKKVSYTTVNTYCTLNTLTNNTKNVWIVFHGLGYLSRYFLRYFETFNKQDHYFIAPQAPSKHYLKNEYKHVGSTWLTKENTILETQNVLNYIDKVYGSEIVNTDKNLIVLGYSQGVSIATRWLASRKIKCDTLILHSGAIPQELNKQDFEYLPLDTKVLYLYGDKDAYINEAKKTEETLKGSQLFGERLEIKKISGIHEVHIPSLKMFDK